LEALGNRLPKAEPERQYCLFAPDSERLLFFPLPGRGRSCGVANLTKVSLVARVLFDGPFSTYDGFRLCRAWFDSALTEGRRQEPAPQARKVVASLKGPKRVIAMILRIGIAADEVHWHVQ